MTTQKKFFEQIKEELDSCKNPLFYFDDDPDGLCSFLLLYRYLREGKGMVVKTTPQLGERFAQKIEEYQPDKVFILDIPMIEEEFIEKVSQPIVWIDHHGLQEPHKVKYFNPKSLGENTMCTSAICYNAVKQDLWIASIGAIADWTSPPYLKEFSKKYPKLLPKNIKTPDAALFSTRAGKLAKILSFLLKGSPKDILACMKILTRIDDPEEILEKTTPQGKFIYKRFSRLNDEYEDLLRMAEEQATKDDFLVFTYTAERHSLTNDLANEIVFRHPKKFVIVGREKSGDVKMSLRCPFVDIPPILENALKGVEGYGGGHPHACGACVKKEDFDEFLKRLKEGMK